MKLLVKKNDTDIRNFMLLSPSANRAKSWTCEHCINWKNKDVSFCARCFWAYPEDYDHIAGNYGKAVYVFFSGDELEDYNRLIELSGGSTAQEAVKKIIHEYVRKS